MNTSATIQSKIKRATSTEAQTIRQNAQGRGRQFIMHVKSYFGVAVIASCSKYPFGCSPGSQTPRIAYTVCRKHALNEEFIIIIITIIVVIIILQSCTILHFFIHFELFKYIVYLAYKTQFAIKLQC